MKFLIFILIITKLFSLSDYQLNILKFSYQEGKKFKTSDNKTFEDTICSIIMTESSIGRNIIGDNYFVNGKEKPFLAKSLGLGQVKLETVILMIKKYPNDFRKYKKYLHKEPFSCKNYVHYITKINYYSDIMNRYKHKHDRRSIKVKRWAKRELNYYKRKMKKYIGYYQLDLILAQYLLTDIKFNVDVSIHYLIYNYEIAKKKKLWNPWMRTIMKYNGGWLNTPYYRKVIKNMKEWKRIKEKYIVN